MPLKWKRATDGFLETDDGRFRIEGHWDKKPGYYELVDTKTGHRKQNTRQHSLKTDAEAITLRESQANRGMVDKHMTP